MQVFKLICLAILLLIGCNTQRSGGQTSPNQKTLFEIVSNRAIWGKDFPLALAYLEPLANSGENMVEMFPGAVRLGNKFPVSQQTEAQVKARTIDSLTRNYEKSPFYQKLNKNFPFQSRPVNVSVLNPPQEDSLVINIIFEGAQLLPPDMTIATIQRELGKPELIKNIAIHARGEERPTILRLYSYAQGTILFGEAEISPGLLNRVYFNLPALLNSLNTNLK